MLVLFVCALVMVDFAILTGYTVRTIVEGLKGNLEANLTVDAENPSAVIGVSTKHEQNLDYVVTIIIYFNSLLYHVVPVSEQYVAPVKDKK